MTTSIRRTWYLGGLAAALLAAGCGSAQTPAGAPSRAPASSAAKSSQAPASASSAAVTLKEGQATVSGKTTTVLTNAAGMTLYYFTSDTPSKVACTGRCAQIWPPLLAPSGQAAAAPGIPGQVSTVKTGLGLQVEYNGHPLYTYVKDSHPGQATGQGVGGKWFVATPDLGASAAPSP
jgi:predicted lipoprotein with Yx(FWY)xxD motif